MEGASDEAVTTLRELMLKESAPASARISAARTVLEYSRRAAGLEEVEARLEELEEFVRAKQEEEALSPDAEGGQRR